MTSEPDDQDPRRPLRNRVACGSCGAYEPVRGDSFPLGWTIAGSGGRTMHLCPACTRARLSHIEARLDLDIEGE